MTVIVLNGCTSAGKTSIAIALQECLVAPHLRLGIDDAFAMLPRRLHDHPDGFFFDRDDRGLVRLKQGVFGEAVLLAHRRTAAEMAADGLDLILDEVLLDDATRHDWIARLPAADTVWVGIHCDLPELERRERERGDRILGQARGQFDLVHAGMRYDLEVDTTCVPPARSAAVIADALLTR